MPQKILLISPVSPFDPQSGAQQRSALLYEALAQCGEVDVLLLEATRGPDQFESRPRPGIIAHAKWHERPAGIDKYRPNAALNTALESADIALSEYDLIVSRNLNPVCKLDIPVGIPVIADLDDWGYRYGDGQESLLSALTIRLKSAYAGYLARRQLKRFSAYFFVSRRDQALHPELRSAVLPNIPFNPPAAPIAQTDSQTILFVGALWYQPNRQGIDHFLAQCWPNIKSRVSHAQLLLVGAASEGTRGQWARHPDVRAPGYVPDLSAAYREAAFTIAPIYFGGGTNIKVLESLAHNRACVTTPHCADAFAEDLVAGGGLSVAPNDAAFIEQCVALFNSETVRDKQAQIGYDIVSTQYNKQRFFDLVAELVNEVKLTPGTTSADRK
ncbi:MAG: glycosyltransferase family 4 protein [Burkholderiales bacterium]|nr:glycosyltransferase family 4 protein [Burkholderiales bacterium]